MRSAPAKLGCVFAAMLLASFGQAHAGVVVSNLSETQHGGSTIYGSGPPQEYAQQFTTGSQSVTLASIEVPLGAASGTFTPSAELVQDNSGVPGSTALTTFTIPTISTSTTKPYPVETLTPTSSVVLSADTTYWLILSATGTGDFKWGYTYSTTFTGPGSLGDYATSQNGGSTWKTYPFSEGPELIQVNSVPEPSSLALMALGVGVAAMAGRFRMKRKAGVVSQA
jgi:hypothetical protein